MTFMELLLSAKLGSTSAFEELFARYKNLLRKYSVVNGVFDEDLYDGQIFFYQTLLVSCEPFHAFHNRHLAVAFSQMRMICSQR